MRELGRSILVVLLSFVFNLTYSQLSVKPATFQELADNLEGYGVTISNVTFNAVPRHVTGNESKLAGIYTDIPSPNYDMGLQTTNEGFGLQTGVVLANLPVDRIPRNDHGVTVYESFNNVWGQTANRMTEVDEPDLVKLLLQRPPATPGGWQENRIHDVAVLEFDFVPLGEKISLKYVFASDEYDYFVCSRYNDVFGFFLSGPDINGPFLNNAVNLATIPGTDLPVAVNTINSGEPGENNIAKGCEINGIDGLQFSQYYVANNLKRDDNRYDSKSEMVFKGFTKPLLAEADVVCGETYHIKIAIADVGDTWFSAGIFFEQNSLSTVPLIEEDNIEVHEVCKGETITLTATGIDGSTYLWSNGETTKEITVVVTDKELYTVTVTPPIGCIEIYGDSLDVVQPLQIGEVQKFCLAGDSTYKVAFQVYGEDSDFYTFSGTGGEISGGLVKIFISDTLPSGSNYTIIVKDNTGCNTETIEGTNECVQSCKVYPVVRAGFDSKICIDGTYQPTDAYVIDAISGKELSEIYENGVGWQILTGNGSLDDTTLVQPVYTPDPLDVGKTVALIVTGYSGSDDPIFCPNVKDTVYIQVKGQPVVEAGDDGTICRGDVFLVQNADTTSVSGIKWRHAGSGALLNDETLTPTYTPTSSDFDQGFVYLYLFGFGESPCNVSYDSVRIEFKEVAQADAGKDADICFDQTFTVESATSSGGNILWTHNGEGTIEKDTTNSPTYTPAGMDAGKEIVLTMLVDVEEPCPDAIDSMILSIAPLVEIDAGPNDTICATDSFRVENALMSNALNVVWTHSGGGVLRNATTMNPTYFPGIFDYGNKVTLFVTGIAQAPCSSLTDSMILSISEPPLINAGDDAEICVQNAHLITNVSASGGVVTWGSNGAGTLDDSDPLNPSYESISSEAPGTVTFVMTVTPDLPCKAIVDTIELLVAEPVLAEAGLDTTICVRSEYEIVGASITNASSYVWSHTGAGELVNDSTLTPTYQPGLTDVYNPVVIYLRAIADYPCTDVIDSIVVTVTGDAIAEAGKNKSVCEEGSIQFEGVTAYGAGTISWEYNGDGKLDISDVNAPIFTPSINEVGDSVQFILTTEAEAPCLNAQDTLSIYVVPKPIVDAGLDTTICYKSELTLQGTSEHVITTKWLHNGGGTLSDENALTPIYTPSPGDAERALTFLLIGQGNSPCDIAIDSFHVELKGDAYASAGDPGIACIGVPFEIENASLIGGINYSWSHNGQGVLSNENSLFPSYTAKIGEEGSVVELTLTVEAIAPCDGTSAVVELTIIEGPEVNAGLDAAICLGEAYTINDASGDRFTTVLWTHDGDGIIENKNSIAPTYIPALTDVGNTVTLTLDVGPLSPCVDHATDQVELLIETPPTLNAGDDQNICSGSDVTISATASNYSTIRWEIVNNSGSGLLQNATTLTPTYLSTPEDEGKVIRLRITANGNGTCLPIVDEMRIRVIAEPNVSAGEAGEICIYDLFELAGTTENVSSFTWTHDGDGVLENESSTTPRYRPSYKDRNGVVTFILTGNPNAPCSNQSISKTYVRIAPEPGVFAGNDRSMCAGSSVSIGESNAVNNVSAEWEVVEGRAANLILENGIHPTYESEVDEGGSQVVLVLKANALSPCTEPALDTVRIDILVIPEFEMTDGEICPGQSFMMIPSPINEYPVQIYSWYTDSIGGTEVHTGEVWEAGPFENSVKYWVAPSRGCRDRRVPVTITVHPNPVADFMTDVEIITERDDTVVFQDNSQNASIGSWSWGDGIIENYTGSSSVPHFYSIQTGKVPKEYAVTLDIVSEKGCTNSQTIYIPIDLKWNIFIPNAFSPNGDNVNDLFVPVTYNIDEIDLKIFNRWGEEIFTTDVVGQGWDGMHHMIHAGGQRSKSPLVKVDTYIYKVKIVNVFGEKRTYRGQVNLIR